MIASRATASITTSVFGIVLAASGAVAVASRWGVLAGLVISFPIVGMISVISPKDLPRGVPSQAPSSHLTLGVLAWLTVLFASEFNFNPERSPNAAAAANLSIENAAELMGFAAAGIVALHIGLRRGLQYFVRTVWGRLWVSWLALLFATALASPVFALSMTRTVQLVVTSFVGVALGLLAGKVGPSIWPRCIRGAILVTSVLVAWGFVVRAWPGGRFTWPGTFPGVAGTVIGFCLLALVSFPSAIGTRWLRWAFLALFGMATLLSQTRSVIAALILSGLAAVAMGKRTLRLPVLVALMVSGYVLVAASPAIGDAIGDYARRGQAAEEIVSLTGRTDLWRSALDLSDAQPFVGYGLHGARTELLATFRWAGTAHNAWIEAALAGGGLGVGLFGAAFLSLTLYAMRRRSVFDASLLLYLFTVSLASESFALPGASAAMLAFAFARLLARRISELNSDASIG